MENSLMSKLYRHLGLGLLLTFISAYIVSTNINLIRLIYSGGVMILLLILQFAIAIILPLRIRKMNTSTVTILYYLYTFLTGLTFSSIFLIYKMSSIIYIFIATSIIFLIFSFIGNNIKKDLKGLGTFLIIGLLSIIVLNIINMFLLNNTLDMVTCIVSLGIFMLYIAYDINKFKEISYYTDEENIAIVGAFNIYLDIINVILRLLKLFGKERN